MSTSLRFPVSHAERAARAVRRDAIEIVDQLVQRVAPGRALEIDGVRWSVSATEQLGCVVLIATVPTEYQELLRVRVEVPRRGRPLDDPSLAEELESDLREQIDVAADGVLDVADRLRAARTL